MIVAIEASLKNALCKKDICERAPLYILIVALTFWFVFLIFALFAGSISLSRTLNIKVNRTNSQNVTEGNNLTSAFFTENRKIQPITFSVILIYQTDDIVVTHRKT